MGGIVELGQLAHEESRRPPVGRDVMQDEQQRVELRAEPEQDRPEHGIPGEIERARRLLGQALGESRLPLAGRDVGEVDLADRHRRRRVDDLHRDPVASDEGGAERLVPGHDGGDRVGERTGNEPSLQAESERLL